MLQPEDGYAAEGVPHPVVSIEDPGLCKLLGKLARWRTGSVKGSPHVIFTHVPEPDAEVSGGGEGLSALVRIENGSSPY